MCSFIKSCLCKALVLEKCNNYNSELGLCHKQRETDIVHLKTKNSKSASDSVLGWLINRIS